MFELFRNTTEARQVFGLSYVGDAVIENAKLPSNAGRDDIYSDARTSKIRRLYQSMPYRPGMRSGVEHLAFFVTYPNFIFLYIASAIAFVFKGLGDVFASNARGLLQTLWSLLKGQNPSAKNTIFKKQKSHLGYSLLGLVFLIPVVAFAALLWIAAQPCHFIFNFLNYMRQFFDAITNIVVGLLIKMIPSQFVRGTKYTSLRYSLRVLGKNALLLAPIALLIAFSIVPFAGPVGAFIGNVVLNVGFTTAAGAINFAILYGLMVGFQAFAATVQFGYNFLVRLMRSFVPALVPAKDHRKVKGAGYERMGTALIEAAAKNPAAVIASPDSFEPRLATSHDRSLDSIICGQATELGEQNHMDDAAAARQAFATGMARQSVQYDNKHLAACYAAGQKAALRALSNSSITNESAQKAFDAGYDEGYLQKHQHYPEDSKTNAAYVMGKIAGFFVRTTSDMDVSDGKAKAKQAFSAAYDTSNSARSRNPHPLGAYLYVSYEAGLNMFNKGIDQSTAEAFFVAGFDDPDVVAKATAAQTQLATPTNAAPLPAAAAAAQAQAAEQRAAAADAEAKAAGERAAAAEELRRQAEQRETEIRQHLEQQNESATRSAAP